MRNTDISNSDDVIDSRQVIARIAELEETRDGADEGTPGLDGDEKAELKALLALQEEASGASDWEHGEILIRDSYFEEYAQELAEDIGAIDSDAKWPAHCIDWERAARDLQMDYDSVEFDGVTYWLRS